MKKILMALLILALIFGTSLEAKAFGKNSNKSIGVIMANSPGGEEVDQLDCHDKVYIDAVFKAEKGQRYLLEARWINNEEIQERFKWETTEGHAYSWIALQPSFKGRLLKIGGGFTDSWKVELYIDGEFLAEKFFNVSC